MSGHDSDNEAGLGQIRAAASAEAPADFLAALNARHLERLIEEENWHDTNHPDFRERVLVAQYHLQNRDDRFQQLIKRLESGRTSMAVSVGTRSSDFGGSGSLGHPPSLVLSNSSVYSSQSLRTSDAASLLRHGMLDEGSQGALEVPVTQAVGRLACSFSFLACSFRSDDLTEWDTHCQSHFKGHLPLTVHCPFPCSWSRTANSGREAWQARIIHIVGEHRGEGMVDTNRRPDNSLVHHLWRKDIIDDAQVKELRKHGRLTGTNVFLRQDGAARDRRRDRRRHAA